MDLQNEIVDRLIATIEPKYISLIGTDAIEKYNFIPLTIKNDCLFIAVTPDGDKSIIAKYVQENFLSNQIKYIEITNEVFSKTTTYIQKNISKYKAENLALDQANGYLHRLNYFFITLLLYVAFLLFCVVTYKIDLTEWHTLFVLIGFVYIRICTIIKRLNDIGTSRWLTLFAFIPIINIIFNIYLIFTPGSKTIKTHVKKQSSNIITKRYLFVYLLLSITIILFPPIHRQLRYGIYSHENFPNNLHFLFSIPRLYQIDLSFLITELLLVTMVICIVYLFARNKLP